MRHYLVSWLNFQLHVRTLIVYAQGKAQATALIRKAYPKATQVMARELDV